MSISIAISYLIDHCAEREPSLCWSGKQDLRQGHSDRKWRKHLSIPEDGSGMTVLVRRLAERGWLLLAPVPWCN